MYAYRRRDTTDDRQRWPWQQLSFAICKERQKLFTEQNAARSKSNTMENLVLVLVISTSHVVKRPRPAVICKMWTIRNQELAKKVSRKFRRPGLLPLLDTLTAGCYYITSLLTTSVPAAISMYSPSEVAIVTSFRWEYNENIGDQSCSTFHIVVTV